MEIRELTTGDLDAVLDSRKRAFGLIPADSVEPWRAMVTHAMAEGRYLGVVDGGRLVATARIHDFEQWWHGRPVSMGGVASVTVAPEDRGRGLGRLIMREVLERCAGLGHALSALYPATTPLYRSLGWEHAGARNRVTLPAEGLRTLADRDGGVKLRRMGPGDAAELRAVLARVHTASRASGPMGWDEPTTRLWLDDEDDFAYLADDGYVMYRWDGDDIDVDNLVAGSEATARALWSLVGTSSSIATTVTATIEPDDPVLWLLRERSTDALRKSSWMLRVVDLPSAIGGRGYPAGVAVDTLLEVDDPQRPANSGAWRLSVSEGRGEAAPAEVPAGEEASRLTIGGLSALFAGVRPAALRRAGLLTAGAPETDDLLGAAFAAKPYMLDYF
ncbi:GNAT family N-acetyltransferase [Sphaerisporangium corydalis]|uniref:Enhanced intracellular survival protein Eis n=1 Tax=Sphaerisporangium corydalis TaxID=1441875 RepID=A0ABV9E956_9ACTN|nr:GNAT family N-acetyltransferase [Sphaerisporangium corydalis]